ncbi:MAG TPA: alcohol dehydrogenase catalytic domain-containing protein [Anaerolineae bacterium]|nr:alcohol dehydrogenase catalytic domain-containing protein [Anaerolineae bacterium]
MRVAKYYSRDDVRLEQMEIPDIGPGEMLVQVKACGLCGSDLMEWYADSKAPAVLGHEPVGFVSRLGSGVSGFTPGDRVFVHHHVPCFVCHHCRRGNYSCCETFKSSGIDPGGFAEYIRVARLNVERDVLHLPERISFEEASLIEPVACAIRGIKRAGVRPGDTVLIIGLGVSGLLFTQLSGVWGAGLIIASDLVRYRLDKALGLGADVAVDPAREDLRATLSARTHGVGADVVVVTVGSADVMREGLELVAKGGTVLIYAPLPPGDTLDVEVCDLLFSEKTLVSTYSCGPDDTRLALDLILEGRIALGGLVTHRFGLEEVGKAMQLAADAGESLKVVIVP